MLFVTFNGLSKNYRACGYRAGWMVVSGEKRHAADYIEGSTCSRRCACAPTCRRSTRSRPRSAATRASTTWSAPGGRLAKQRDLAYELLTAIPGRHLRQAAGGAVLFPRLDPKIYPIKDDQEFVLELLREEKVLLVQGTGFNWPEPDHFRVVFLPNADDLTEAIARIARFLDSYRKRRHFS